MKKQRSKHTRIVAALRQAWLKFPERHEVKRRVKHPEKSNLFKCETCQEYREKIYIDHIDPVVSPKEGFVNWNDFINRLFVPATALAAICFDCHKDKTKRENQKRREQKSLSKLVCQHDDPSWCTDKCPKRKKK